MTFQCPSCDKTLRQNAKSCECGWELKPTISADKSSLLSHSLDHQCAYNDHGSRCRYPVNFFEPGQTRAMCRYHKKHLGNLELCAKILDRSHRDSDEQYQARSNKETYGDGRSRLEQEIYDYLHKTVAARREQERAAA